MRQTFWKKLFVMCQDVERYEVTQNKRHEEVEEFVQKLRELLFFDRGCLALKN